MHTIKVRCLKVENFYFHASKIVNDEPPGLHFEINEAFLAFVGFSFPCVAKKDNWLSWSLLDSCCVFLTMLSKDDTSTAEAPERVSQQAHLLVLVGGKMNNE